MKNLFKRVGTRGLGLCVIVLVLTAGMAVVGCSNGSTDPGTDPALNGTWVDGPDGMTFNNGNFESIFNDIPQFKGTYTTGNSTITRLHTFMVNPWKEILRQDGIQKLN